MSAGFFACISLSNPISDVGFRDHARGKPIAGLLLVAILIAGGKNLSWHSHVDSGSHQQQGLDKYLKAQEIGSDRQSHLCAQWMPLCQSLVWLRGGLGRYFLVHVEAALAGYNLGQNVSRKAKV